MRCTKRPDLIDQRIERRRRLNINYTMFSITAPLTLIINALLMVKPATAAYTQVAAHYTPANFFDGFDFFNGTDPTNGFVQYVPNCYTVPCFLNTYKTN